MFRAYLKNGEYVDFPEGGKAEWETEEVTNNLVVSTETRVAIFNGDQWTHVIEDRESDGD
ncbi:MULTISPECIES: hypothetical protein [Mycobacteroides]|uniref:hypothetical protein n=1 Tax=Mycobacteroides TaxID=670516 RepID=UPI0007128677|nr:MULTISPECIES: hypothetical protein [Mycobacteroides]DAZ90246.1 TPA_asm: hypothetical protein PROPHIFSIL01-1_59 [Mycobacterium phage prophiFSIL01-1]KRQ31352.1 hypothetical protein AOT86_01720 [Mycobacteroides sp. H072]KRQ35890.1 hypothetical protein AOT84_15390 [Mycobacteroides sp. H002]KRQ50571.1 hypothetical protein AOT85_13840 [Mycobacteroides sp. H054]KRQ72668.1 hypothetical protein AOT83_04685 [Mycobacteroides sp. H001]